MSTHMTTEATYDDQDHPRDPVTQQWVPVSRSEPSARIVRLEEDGTFEYPPALTSIEAAARFFFGDADTPPVHVSEAILERFDNEWAALRDRKVLARIAAWKEAHPKPLLTGAFGRDKTPPAAIANWESAYKTEWDAAGNSMPRRLEPSAVRPLARLKAFWSSVGLVPDEELQDANKVRVNVAGKDMTAGTAVIKFCLSEMPAESLRDPSRDVGAKLDSVVASFKGINSGLAAVQDEIERLRAQSLTPEAYSILARKRGW